MTRSATYRSARSAGLSLLQVLRQERLPVVCAALIALVFRLMLLGAGPALALSGQAQASEASPLPLILCNPLSVASAEEVTGQPVPVAPAGAHDPGHCLCASGCLHGTGFSAVADQPVHGLTRPERSTLAPLPLASSPRRSNALLGSRAIRGPPSV